MEHLRGFISTEELECLRKANIESLKSVILYDPGRLQTITSLPLSSIRNITLQAVRVLLGDNPIRTADTIPPFTRIPTGCGSIDEVTKGGIPVNGITEIVGYSGVGKTQLCLQLSLTTQLETNKGVVYICTEKAFPSKRFVELAEEYRVRFRSNIRFEDHIFIQHIVDYNQLRKSLSVQIPRLIQNKNIGMVIIDSIAGIYRSEIDVNYADRSQEFVVLANDLNEVGRNKIALVCTNQVSDNTETGRTEPCLGLAWSHMVTRRFTIVRQEGSVVRKFRVTFAPDLEDKSCSFLLTRQGLINCYQ